MRCQSHVAHGTSQLYHLVLVSTQFTQPRASGLQCVNHTETATSTDTVCVHIHCNEGPECEHHLQNHDYPSAFTLVYVAA